MSRVKKWVVTGVADLPGRVWEDQLVRHGIFHTAYVEDLKCAFGKLRDLESDVGATGRRDLLNGGPDDAPRRTEGHTANRVLSSAPLPRGLTIVRLSMSLCADHTLPCFPFNLHNSINSLMDSFALGVVKLRYLLVIAGPIILR